MRFNGNQPRIMYFGRVKVGDHYSVSPEATLGPTQEGTRERKWAESEERERRDYKWVRKDFEREDESQSSDWLAISKW
jgi:hypothetical protein